jgi:hypothetical protein
MTIEDIIMCMNVVGHHNPNMMSLHDSLVEQSALMAEYTDLIINENANGLPMYESIVLYQIELANAIHDYVYNVVRPLDSVMAKNVTREQVCREIFGLQAEF